MIPGYIRAAAARWTNLNRAERRDLARSLRRHGLSYGEIAEVVPVPKGTLSSWCRGIELTTEQRWSIQARKIRARDTQRKRHAEIASIRQSAREVARSHRGDAFFIGGVTLYWAEGSKSTRRLEMANSDPRLLTFFIEWAREYFSPDADFVLALNIHADNDLAGAKRFWTDALPLHDPKFTKAFIKPDGTGHRKNHLAHGVCRVRMRRSTDAWVQAMAWIDEIAHGGWFDRAATLSGGR